MVAWMILENAFYTVIRLTFGKSVQDCTAPPSSQSLFGASKTLMKNHFYQTRRQLLVFFSLGLTWWSCPRCHPLGGAEEMPPRRPTGLAPRPFKHEKYCSLGPFVQCFLSLPQKPFPICELGNSRYCCPGSLQMSSPLLGWAEQSFNWTLSSSFCSPQPWQNSLHPPWPPLFTPKV